jgi:hypothetical protein
VTEHVVIPPNKYARNNGSVLDDQHQYGYGASGANVVNGGTWTHLWLDHDRISVKTVDHRLGMLKSGKKFSRFEPHSQLTLNFKPNLRVFYSFRRKGGEKVINDITSRTLGMGGNRLLTPYLLDRAAFATDAPEADYRRGNRNQYVQHLNAWLWQRIAFPLLREAPHWDAVTGMAPALRQRNLQDFTRVAFGPRYRKDLVKAIASAKRLDGVWLANQLQTTFPIDWLIPLIGEQTPGYEDMRPIRKFMRWLPEYSARRLLLDLVEPEPNDNWRVDRNAWTVPDTLRSWNRILQAKPDYTLGDYRITNWRDMHDQLAREFDKIGREDRQIEATKVAKKLDGKSLNGLTLVHPKSTHELIDWGKNMHNCIGGYDRHAAAGKSVLFAVMQGDEMIGNMELDPKGSIRQLVGDYNRALPDPLRDTVYEMVGKPIPATYEDDDFPF